MVKVSKVRSVSCSLHILAVKANRLLDVTVQSSAEQSDRRSELR